MTNITFKTMETKKVRNIKVLGIGSSKYRQLTYNLFTVIEELDLEAKVEQFQEVDDFLRFNIVEIPSLMVDGEIIVKGYVPNMEELKTFLQL